MVTSYVMKIPYLIENAEKRALHPFYAAIFFPLLRRLNCLSHKGYLRCPLPKFVSKVIKMI